MHRQSLLFAVAMAALLSFAAGCGDDDGRKGSGSGKGGGTKKLSKPVKELLVGTWKATVKLDEEKAMAELRKDAEKAGQKVTDEQLKQQFEMVKKMIENSTLMVTFNADGTSSSSTEMPNPFDAKAPPKKETDKGKWELLSEEGNKVTLKVTPTDGPKKDKPTEFKLTFVDDTTFSVEEIKGDEMPPGTMTFKKQ